MTLQRAETGLWEFSARTREENLERMSRETFDIAVIGGGATGAGIARDAAMRGLSVCLAERGDFATGTSSRSSRLLHGGLRYLETYDFKLVHEACLERRKLGQLAPHLSVPIPFLFPVYEDSSTGWLLLKAGMLTYDLMAMFRNYRNHRSYRAQGLAGIEPELNRVGLKGGFVYYDARTDDGRLTLATILSAANHGAVLANYAAVTALPCSGGKIHGIVVRDVLGGREVEVRAQQVIDAAGPWSDDIRSMDPTAQQRVLRPTKGVHFVARREDLPVRHAVVMTDQGRVMFVIPWGAFVYVGTTDTDISAPFDEPFATAEDIDYLLSVVAKSFPHRRLTESDIISTWAGIRPLVDPQQAVAAGKVSREHRLYESPAGLISICGGKLTTYRLMAAQTVSRALRYITSAAAAHAPRSTPTGGEPLIGGEMGDPLTGLPREFEEPALIPCITRDIRAHLYQQYGSRGLAVAAMAAEQPEYCGAMIPGLPFIHIEILHAVRHEMAVRLADVLIRRLPVLYQAPDQGLALAPRAAEIMARELSWTPERTAEEIAEYGREVALNRQFRRQDDALPRNAPDSAR